MARWIALLPPAFERLALRPHVSPLADEVRGDVGRVLWILLAAVGVVLLIACGNVANLFLVRVEGRQQELAMRAALGAGRARLARVLLTESVLLALVGGALGLALARAALGLLRRIAPAELPRVNEIGLDPAVLLFALGISVLSGALFGLVAVVRLGTPGIRALKEGGRGASDGPGRLRARNVLVVSQIALALTLLIVSGLMIRTFVAMRRVQPGFVRPEQVQTFRLDIPEGLIADGAQAARAYRDIAARLKEVPGVVSVGLSSSVTMDGEDNGNPLSVEDVPQEDPPLRRFKSVGPGYFEAMGIRLVAGRSITWEEIDAQRPVIVISDSLAREYWKEPARAIGRRVRATGNAGSDQPAWREVVGVVGNERDDGLTRPATAIVYWPLLNESYDWRGMAVVVRSGRVGTPGFMRELQQAVWSVNPNLPVADARTLDGIVAASMAQTSFAMVMLAISAGVALLLGVVGIYGVIAYVAAQRTREIGIRMALGAQIGDVRRMFLRLGLSLTVAGIACGTAAALALTRVMSALLFGVGPMDPITYAAVSGLLAVVTLLATYLPARRAVRVDPVVAFRTTV
jgi:predicted permease